MARCFDTTSTIMVCVALGDTLNGFTNEQNAQTKASQCDCFEHATKCGVVTVTGAT